MPPANDIVEAFVEGRTNFIANHGREPSSCIVSFVTNGALRQHMERFRGLVGGVTGEVGANELRIMGVKIEPSIYAEDNQFHFISDDNFHSIVPTSYEEWRDRRLVQQLRPYQEEINRAAERVIAEGIPGPRFFFDEDLVFSGRTNAPDFSEHMNAFREEMAQRMANGMLATGTAAVRIDSEAFRGAEIPVPITPGRVERTPNMELKIKLHLKKRDGWTRQMDGSIGTIYERSATLTVPEQTPASANTMGGMPTLETIRRVDYRMVKSSYTEDFRTNKAIRTYYYEEI